MDTSYDIIGYWSEIKLDIIREYARAYSLILSKRNFTHLYIDAFAGHGLSISRTTGDFVMGSPLNALNVAPSFKEFHFIDIDELRVDSLEQLAAEREDVSVYQGDCNSILLEKILPRVQWALYRRALCLLDPYGLQLDWKVIRAAGSLKTIDLFLNFPVMDMNRNVLWTDPLGVSDERKERMNRYWGDDSWQKVVYDGSGDLFGHETKQGNPVIAAAFRERLRAVADFENVPDPIPMRNSKGSIVYYLYFASQKPVAMKIVQDIFSKYRLRMN